MQSSTALEATSSAMVDPSLEPSRSSGSAAGSTQVRELTLKECKAAAYTLALAFANDEVSRYFLDTPDLSHWKPEQKWKLHLSIMEHLTYLHCLCGTVTAVGPDYDCVALWHFLHVLGPPTTTTAPHPAPNLTSCRDALTRDRLPPGRTADSLKAQFRSGIWRLRYKLSREGRARFFDEFFPLLHDTKLAVLGAQADADSYYLVYIGTKPDRQGHGLARKCMEWGLHRADREGKLCYLESSNDVNLKIYGRMGFRVSRQIRLNRGVGSGSCSNGNGLSTGNRKVVQVEHRGASEETSGSGKEGEVILDIMVRDPAAKG